MLSADRLLFIALSFFAGSALSCAPKTAAADAGASGPGTAADPFAARIAAASREAALPPELSAALAAAARDERPALEAELAAIRAADPFLTVLVDKQRPLPEGYAPADLVELSDSSYRVNRKGHKLRAEAAASLERMGSAARAEGVSLLVSSAYRSLEYQKTVYARIVAELGQEAADRESARPGHSQHQLGLAADFGSIDDSFAATPASRWLLANAGRFGWSLSFPQGYEALTGYRWESWHYRYVGPAAAAFIDRRFGGIQQYALQFLDALGHLP